MGKKRRNFLAALTAALLLCACAGEQPEAPADPVRPAQPYTLTVRTGEAQDTLDPASVTARGGETILYHLYENLLRWEDGGDGWAVLAPGQAESYTVETDYAGNATYTFTLREGIVWSDGTPVTAGDFVSAWTRLADPANGLPHRELMSAISGCAEAWESGDMSLLAVSAGDDRTLTVTLSGSPAWFLEEVCAGAYTMPVHPGAASGEGTVTNGAYTAASMDGGAVVLTRSETYYAPDPRGPETIRFQTAAGSQADYEALLAGEAALVTGLPAEPLQALADGDLWTPEPVKRVYGVLLNTRQAPFDDPNVRLAFHLAVDREAAVRALEDLTARPAPGIVPYGVSDYSERPAEEAPAKDETLPDPIAQQPEAEEPWPTCWDFRAHSLKVVTAEHTHDYESDSLYAQALLAQAGYPGGQGFPAVEYIYTEQDGGQAVARALQAMWKRQLGVTVTLRCVSQEEYDAALAPVSPGEDGEAGDGGETEAAPLFQMAAQDFSPAYSDAGALLERWYSASADNAAGYASDAFDILLDSARAAVSPDARDAYLHDAEAILLQDSPVIPVLCRGGSYRLDDALTGLYRAPDGVFFLYGVHTQAAAG